MVDLSVICVVRNEEHYISEALTSILETMPDFIDFEIIIVDDHSTDKTYEICQKFLYGNNVVKLYQNNGVGKVAGTVFGLEMASKPWIKFVDGDDFVNFRSLKAQDFNCCAFYHDYYRFSGGGKLKYVRTSKSLAAAPSAWNFNLRSIPKGMFFFKKSLIDSEDMKKFDVFLYEDSFINFLIAKNASKLFKLNKPLYFYRQHDQNFFGDKKFSKKRIMMMSYRLASNYENISAIYPHYPINKHIPTYCDALQGFNWYNHYRLALSPHLMIKAIIYRYYAKL